MDELCCTGIEQQLEVSDLEIAAAGRAKTSTSVSDRRAAIACPARVILRLRGFNVVGMEA